MKVASYLVLFASLVAVGAYGSRQVSAQSSKPRIFFIEPKNGATVKSPVHLKFGIENYKIAAVPDGTVTTARPDVGHYHVGVDQACLKPPRNIGPDPCRVARHVLPPPLGRFFSRTSQTVDVTALSDSGFFVSGP